MTTPAEVWFGAPDWPDQQVTPRVKTGAELLDEIEVQLFAKRSTMEVLWLEIGGLCSEIVRHKLYKYRQDENGNYFRTAQGYFRDLERRFKEKGLPLSYTGINRFVSDHRLYREELGYADADLVQLGKSALDEMAPTVRKKLKDEGPEAAKAFVDDVLAAAKANEGLPLHEVREAVNEATGRVMKGLEITFTDGLFGQRMEGLTLWWGGAPIDLLKQELTEDQAAWLKKRLGIKQQSSSPLL